MKKNTLGLAVALAGSCVFSVAHAEDISKAFTDGKVLGDFRLRYEQNDTNNNLKTADALTLRSRLGFETAPVAGVNFLIEGSNTSAVIDDYAPENVAYNIIADPTDTTLNRIQLAYNQDGISAVIGRQRIIFDNARMVGNVGWRQQEQTYDAVKLGYKNANLNVQYAFANQVHDPAFHSIESANHLLNVNYTGLGFGAITGYAYLLDNKEAAATAQAKNNTFGARLAGKQALDGLDLIYSAEAATQSTDDYSALYLAGEGGVVVSGMTAAIGIESLGSDDKKYGFQTPLATKHAFNGWADKFLTTPNNGLNDVYVKVGGKVANVNLLAFYHDYSAAKGSVDYGSETNLLASYDFAKYYSVGAKYATYSKGDAGTDTDKIWAWIEAKF
ncbi:MAG: hypothetical protein RL217_1070 [Pseudomonadota bacterium]